MFKITITDTQQVHKILPKQWQVVGQEEKLSEFGEDGKTCMHNVYDYTPQVEALVEETRAILVQEVETLNLAAVIKAVNGLE
ncbi:hypothetical protein LCGC14_0892950 [marine sediment metagenome]|uniref:Uncharacterized protein n=1 Tax=marine sediment metagenome TaxID=412755 RepID=A0A0F9PJB8_9ZZZZ